MTGTLHRFENLLRTADWSIVRRSWRYGAGGCIYAGVRYLVSHGQAPSAAKGSVAGLLGFCALVFAAAIAGSAVVAVVWPLTTRRWHGAVIGATLTLLGSLLIYWTIVPWHLGLPRVLWVQAWVLPVGALMGASMWSSPTSAQRGAD